LLDALAQLAADGPVLFPVHPRTQARIRTLRLTVGAGDGVRLLEPLPYLEMLGLISDAGLVITDSGGLQEETTWLGVPCVTVRPNTERPITCTIGTNRLVSPHREAIAQAARAARAQRPPTPPGLAADQVFARLGQQRILQSGLATCYVAIGPEGKPCYMQWLIPSSENDRVRTFFGNLYPQLGPDEVLLEGAYTPEAHRGQGIMASAMAQIAQQAAHSGARWA